MRVKCHLGEARRGEGDERILSSPANQNIFTIVSEIFTVLRLQCPRICQFTLISTVAFQNTLCRQLVTLRGQKGFHHLGSQEGQI